MTIEKIIEASAVSVLNLIIHSMMEHCFILAHENELSFLKGLIPAENIGEFNDEAVLDWAADLALLALVQDKPVVYLLNMIRKIEQHILVYSKNNGLDRAEIAEDEEISEQSRSTWMYVIGEMRYQNYGEILNTLGWLIECYGMVIWNLAHQQILSLDDVFLQTELEYYTWDGDVPALDIKNENARFLLGIYTDIQLDAAEIEQFKTDYNGKV
jgi:hypothetical protein